MDSEEYKGQLLKLLPQGVAWYFEDDKNLPKLLHAFADDAEIVDGAVQGFLEDFFPDTTSQFLSDWERVAGLPDPCSGLAESVGLRRKDLLTRLTSVGGQSPQYFIDLAASLGYTITITEFDPFRVDYNSVEDALYDEDWQHVWQVNGLENEIQEFHVDENSVEDPLVTWGQGRLECLINRLKPAHTLVIFNYS